MRRKLLHYQTLSLMTMMSMKMTMNPPPKEGGLENSPMTPLVGRVALFPIEMTLVMLWRMVFLKRAPPIKTQMATNAISKRHHRNLGLEFTIQKF